MSHGLLTGAAALSGASALIYENLWFRSAALSLGSGAWSSALVLAAFMAGLALGSAIVARRETHVQQPLRAYAIVELVIGVAGVAALLLLGRLTSFLAPVFSALDSLWVVNLVRVTVAFLLLVVPAAAMGATLPLLIRALAVEPAAFGPALGTMYGANTAGAVLGVLVCELVLVPELGIVGAGVLASALNVGACVLALRVKRPAVVSVKPKRNVPMASPTSAPWPLLVAAFLTGAVFLSFEAVFFRFQLLFFTALSTTFAVMLAVVLAGIAVGGVAGVRVLATQSRTIPRLAMTAFAAALTLLVCYRGFATIVEPAVRMGAFPGALLTACVLAFPLAVLSGVMFTLIGDALHAAGLSATRATAVLTIANTAGGAVGAVVTGFYLIAAVGLEMSFRLLIGAYVAIGAGIAVTANRGRVHLPTMVVGGAACFASIALFPNGLMRDVYVLFPAYTLMQAGEQRVAVREGQLETVQYLRADVLGEPAYYRLLVNDHSMSASEVRSRRYMRLFALLPRMLHPAPRKAALLGLGLGVTAKTLTDDARLDRIDVVDISRDIPAMLEVVYPGAGESPLEDSRVRLHIEDGRFFLQTTTTSYDIITGEPPPPHFAGVAAVYSREFFQLVERRLNPGGLVTYWLPVHDLKLSEAQSIARAFLDVFPNGSLWAGAGFDWILMAAKPPATRVTAEQLDAWWGTSASETLLRGMGLDDAQALAGLFLADGRRFRGWTADAPPLTDNFPRLISLDRPRDEHDVGAFLELLSARDAVTNFTSSAGIRMMWPDALRDRVTEAAFERQARLSTILSLPILTTRHVSALLGEGKPDPLLVKALFWRHAFDVDRAAGILASEPARSGDDELEFRAATAMMDGRFNDAAEILSRVSADRAPRVATIRLFCAARAAGAAG